MTLEDFRFEYEPDMVQVVVYWIGDHKYRSVITSIGSGIACNEFVRVSRAPVQIVLVSDIVEVITTSRLWSEQV